MRENWGSVPTASLSEMQPFAHSGQDFSERLRSFCLYTLTPVESLLTATTALGLASTGSFPQAQL